MTTVLNHNFTLKKVDFASLDATSKRCLQLAVEVRKNAYCKYSNFPVGATALSENGDFFTGCNVENSSFAGICAERTAYSKGISEGCKKFKLVAVVAEQANKLITPPCGNCRQFMGEFGDVTVLMARPNLEEVFICTLFELLPIQFVFK